MHQLQQQQQAAARNSSKQQPDTRQNVFCAVLQLRLDWSGSATTIGEQQLQQQHAVAACSSSM
jgi:hypothetical protein